MSEPAQPGVTPPPDDVGSLDRRFNASFLAQKRAASRHQMPSQTTVEYVLCYEIMRRGDRKFWVTTRDISRTGISFYHFEPMYAGEVVRIELRMDRGKVRYVDAHVARCRRLGNGTYEIGAAFQQRQADTPPLEPPKQELPDIPWIFR